MLKSFQKLRRLVERDVKF